MEVRERKKEGRNTERWKGEHERIKNGRVKDEGSSIRRNSRDERNPQKEHIKIWKGCKSRNVERIEGCIERERNRQEIAGEEEREQLTMMMRETQDEAVDDDDDRSDDDGDE